MESLSPIKQVSLVNKVESGENTGFERINKVVFVLQEGFHGFQDLIFLINESIQ